MKILLTGSSGFVGRYMSEEMPCIPLNDAGRHVDLRDSHQLDDVVFRLKPDAVIHLATQSFVPESFKNPRETFDINFIGTFNLLSALKATGFSGRLLFVGSGDIYGLVPPEQLPISEAFPLKPRNPYAVSKVAAEALCFQWSQTEGFDIVMVRPFSHIGPGQSERFVLSDFAMQIAEIKHGRRKPVLRVGDIDVTRDFTDVRDVVRAYQLLLQRGKSGEIYNVCSGREFTVRGLLNDMLEIAGVKASIEQENERFRPSEQRRVFGSFKKLYDETGWSPEIPIEQTLGDILEYWRRKIDV